MNFPTAGGNQRLTIAFSIGTLLGLLAHSELLAQQFIFPRAVGKNRNAALYEQYTLQLDLKKQAAENRIEFCLNDIDHACQLTDAQRKKLVVAGKGAVASFMTKVTEEFQNAAKQVGFDFEPGNPPEKVDDEDEPGNVVPARQVFLMNADGGMNQPENAVDQEKIWKQAVKNALTEDQGKKHQSWVGKRQSLREKAAVDSFVARVDQKLLLSPDQRKKLTAWLGDTYAEKLADMPQVRNQGFVVMNAGQAEQTPAIKGAVAAILTGSQREVWALSFQKELDQLNQVRGNARLAVPAFRMLPAAPVKKNDDDN